MGKKRRKKDNDMKEVSYERLREISGVLLIFVGVFIFISLLAKPFHLRLLGAVGDAIASTLSLIVGGYVAFFLPVLIIYLAISLIQRTIVSKVWFRMLGIIMITVSLCLILALIPSKIPSETSEEIFHAGGIIGNFIVQYEGLRLPYYVGTLGTVLISGCVLLIGIALTFDISIVSLAGNARNGGVALLNRVATTVRPSEEKREEREKEREKRRDEKQKKTEEKKRKKDIKKRPLVLRHTALKTEPPPKEKKKSEPEPGELAQQDLFNKYKLPPASLLDEPPEDNAISMTDDELERLSDVIERTLKDYGIEAHVNAVTQGPVVTRFELRPAPGVKINKILTLEKELCMVLRARSVRIQAPIPGKSAIGIEIPNPEVAVVYMKEIMQVPKLDDHKSTIAFGLGKTISGEPYICDLTSMPHLLIAGATGSGKSVAINSIICAMLMRQPPDRVKFLLIDPKRVELSVYEDIPHLISPVVCEAREAAAALSWVVTLMEERYKQLVEVGVRNLSAYNKMFVEGKSHPKDPTKPIKYMAPIVVIIDELADLMVVARQAVEENIIRLSQLARAVGIHLIIATQRPSVNVITGIIKANFPSRIAFQVTSKVDSRTILDMNGAEVLIGRGDMLFVSGGGHKPMRVQGTFVSDGEVERLVDFIKQQDAKPEYMVEKFEVEKKKGDGRGGRFSGGSAGGGIAKSYDGAVTPSVSDEAEDAINDELFDEALKTILLTGKASTSYLQRKLKIGYVRAGRLMDLLESEGIVGPARGSKTREILVDAAEYLSDYGFDSEDELDDGEED
jgi:S-DNA-T family DNA segregation ATPase FtsK/SpoIIIE